MKFLIISFNRIVSLVLCGMLLFALSCKQEVVEEKSLTQSGSQQDAMYSMLLKRGYKPNRITDIGKHYLVEGDITFPKMPISQRGAKPNHFIIGEAPIVSYFSTSTITVSINESSFSNGNSTAWRQKVLDATNRAINSWNGLPNNNANFVLLSGYDPSADLVILHEPSLLDYQYGQADGPTGCDVNAEVRLNALTANLDVDQLHRVIAHEFSHPLGFTHTDRVDEPGTVRAQIIGTPFDDANSLFNSGTFDQITNNPNSVPFMSQKGFSTDDKNAISILFPDTPTATAFISGNKVGVRWTFTKFCETDVQLVFTEGNVEIKRTLAPNSGYYELQSPTISPKKIYRITISGSKPGITPLSTEIYNP